MSVAFKIQEFANQCARQSEALAAEAEVERRNHHRLINGLVRMSQYARIDQNYALSDEIRALLKDSGVQVMQGTVGYHRFQDIPKELIGRPLVDTWKFIDKC